MSLTRGARFEVVGGEHDGRKLVYLRTDGDKAVINYKTSDWKLTTEFVRIPRRQLDDPSMFRRV